MRFSEGAVVEIVVETEREDLTDFIDDWDGEVLSPVTEGMRPSSLPSGGSSMIIRRGLSSMGVIRVDAIELRWDIMVRLSPDERYEEGTIVPLVLEA